MCKLVQQVHRSLKAQSLGYPALDLGINPADEHEVFLHLNKGFRKSCCNLFSQTRYIKAAQGEQETTIFGMFQSLDCSQSI